MQPIVFAPVTLSKEEYVTVNYLLWRSLPRTRRNNWILGVALLLLAISFGISWYQAKGYPPQGSGLWLLLVGLLYGLGRSQLTRWLLGRGYAQNQAVLATPTGFTLTAEEIRGESALGQFSGKWTLIRRAVWVESNWLLLYPTETACYYLDLRQLRAPATPSDLEQLLRANQIPQRRV